MNVWTYWSGPMPRWISTCLESMRRCCRQSTLHILTPDNCAPVGGVVHPRWITLPPGVGTDCLRAALLYRYGGLWVDADTVCVRDPIELITNRHDPKQFLYSRWPSKPDRVIAGYVYAPQGHPIAKRWLDYVNGALEHAENIGWGDLGEKALTPLVNLSCSPESSWKIPIETFLPVDIDTRVKRYFERSGWRDFMTPNTIAFGLNYSWMNEHRREVMEQSPIGSQLMIHRLLSEAAIAK